MGNRLQVKTLNASAFVDCVVSSVQTWYKLSAHLIVFRSALDIAISHCVLADRNGEGLDSWGSLWRKPQPRTHDGQFCHRILLWTLLGEREVEREVNFVNPTGLRCGRPATLVSYTHTRTASDANRFWGLSNPPKPPESPRNPHTQGQGARML